MQKLFLTFFYSGLSPKAPGTVGTLAALPFGLAILYYLDVSTLFLITIFATIAGVFEASKYEKQTGIHDDKSIVIDEAVGIWLALIIVSSVLNIYTVILSFIFFRFFDIKKPSIIGKIDRADRGGLSVMGDDVIAGIAGGTLAFIVWQYGLSNFL
ncbi:MAG: phosphatidylglycerophosphatase A family protein [Campylobacterota bacterium]